jgi:hypothetical protein
VEEIEKVATEDESVKIVRDGLHVGISFCNDFSIQLVTDMDRSLNVKTIN